MRHALPLEPRHMSLLKTADGGGMSQAEALRLLRSYGIPARAGCSPYVGHYGIEVTTHDRRLLKRAARLLF